MGPWGRREGDGEGGGRAERCSASHAYVCKVHGVHGVGIGMAEKAKESSETGGKWMRSDASFLPTMLIVGNVTLLRI